MPLLPRRSPLRGVWRERGRFCGEKREAAVRRSCGRAAPACDDRGLWAMPDRDPSASPPVTARNNYHAGRVNSSQGACLTEKYPGEREGERLAPSKSAAQRPRFLPSRTNWLGGRTFGFALQTRARGAVFCGLRAVGLGEAVPARGGCRERGTRQRRSRGRPEGMA